MENQINPYQTPDSDSAPVEDYVNPIPASKTTRILNLLIDYIMQIVVMVVSVVIASFVGGAELVEKIENMPDIVLGLLMMIPYYILMESLFGRTVGKLVTGTKVVNETGGPPGFWQIVGRTFARLIPFEVFSFLGSETRGWHDSMPNTYVIKCR